LVGNGEGSHGSYRLFETPDYGTDGVNTLCS
jgi:hypothetical protein